MAGFIPFEKKGGVVPAFFNYWKPFVDVAERDAYHRHLRFDRLEHLKWRASILQ
jgi:hypothetical protein